MVLALCLIASVKGSLNNVFNHMATYMSDSGADAYTSESASSSMSSTTSIAKKSGGKHKKHKLQSQEDGGESTPKSALILKTEDSADSLTGDDQESFLTSRFKQRNANGEDTELERSVSHVGPIRYIVRHTSPDEKQPESLKSDKKKVANSPTAGELDLMQALDIEPPTKPIMQQQDSSSATPPAKIGLGKERSRGFSFGRFSKSSNTKSSPRASVSSSQDESVPVGYQSPTSQQPTRKLSLRQNRAQLIASKVNRQATATGQKSERRATIAVVSAKESSKTKTRQPIPPKQPPLVQDTKAPYTKRPSIKLPVNGQIDSSSASSLSSSKSSSEMFSQVLVDKLSIQDDKKKQRKNIHRRTKSTQPRSAKDEKLQDGASILEVSDPDGMRSNSQASSNDSDKDLELPRNHTFIGEPPEVGNPLKIQLTSIQGNKIVNVMQVPPPKIKKSRRHSSRELSFAQDAPADQLNVIMSPVSESDPIISPPSSPFLTTTSKRGDFFDPQGSNDQLLTVPKKSGSFSKGSSGGYHSDSDVTDKRRRHTVIHPSPKNQDQTTVSVEESKDAPPKSESVQLAPSPTKETDVQYIKGPKGREIRLPPPVATRRSSAPDTSAIVTNVHQHRLSTTSIAGSSNGENGSSVSSDASSLQSIFKDPPVNKDDKEKKKKGDIVGMGSTPEHLQVSVQKKKRFSIFRFSSSKPKPKQVETQNHREAPPSATTYAQHNLYGLYLPSETSQSKPEQKDPKPEKIVADEVAGNKPEAKDQADAKKTETLVKKQENQVSPWKTDIYGSLAELLEQTAPPTRTKEHHRRAQSTPPKNNDDVKKRSSGFLVFHVHTEADTSGWKTVLRVLSPRFEVLLQQQLSGGSKKTAFRFFKRELIPSHPTDPGRSFPGVSTTRLHRRTISEHLPLGGDAQVEKVERPLVDYHYAELEWKLPFEKSNQDVLEHQVARRAWIVQEHILINLTYRPTVDETALMDLICLQTMAYLAKAVKIPQIQENKLAGLAWVSASESKVPLPHKSVGHVTFFYKHPLTHLSILIKEHVTDPKIVQWEYPSDEANAIVPASRSTTAKSSREHSRLREDSATVIDESLRTELTTSSNLPAEEEETAGAPSGYISGDELTEKTRPKRDSKVQPTYLEFIPSIVKGHVETKQLHVAYTPLNSRGKDSKKGSRGRPGTPTPGQRLAGTRYAVHPVIFRNYAQESRQWTTIRTDNGERFQEGTLPGLLSHLTHPLRELTRSPSMSDLLKWCQLDETQSALKDSKGTDSLPLVIEGRVSDGGGLLLGFKFTGPAAIYGWLDGQGGWPTGHVFATQPSLHRLNPRKSDSPNPNPTGDIVPFLLWQDELGVVRDPWFGATLLDFNGSDDKRVLLAHCGTQTVTVESVQNRPDNLQLRYQDHSSISSLFSLAKQDEKVAKDSEMDELLTIKSELVVIDIRNTRGKDSFKVHFLTAHTVALEQREHNLHTLTVWPHIQPNGLRYIIDLKKSEGIVAFAQPDVILEKHVKVKRNGKAYPYFTVHRSLRQFWDQQTRQVYEKLPAKLLLHPLKAYNHDLKEFEEAPVFAPGAALVFYGNQLFLFHAGRYWRWLIKKKPRHSRLFNRTDPIKIPMEGPFNLDLLNDGKSSTPNVTYDGILLDQTSNGAGKCILSVNGLQQILHIDLVKLIPQKGKAKSGHKNSWSASSSSRSSLSSYTSGGEPVISVSNFRKTTNLSEVVKQEDFETKNHATISLIRSQPTHPAILKVLHNPMARLAPHTNVRLLENPWRPESELTFLATSDVLNYTIRL